MATATGSVSVGTSAVALTGTATPFTRQVLVKADGANSNKIYVGFSSSVTAASAAATDGYQLGAGQELAVDAAMMGQAGLSADASLIYLIGGAVSQKAFFLTY